MTNRTQVSSLEISPVSFTKYLKSCNFDQISNLSEGSKTFVITKSRKADDNNKKQITLMSKFQTKC